MGAKMIDAIPRPEVTPERYRELQVIRQSIGTLYPHNRPNDCLILFDMIREDIRRLVLDERMANHPRATVALDYEVVGSNVVPLTASERK